MRPRECPSLPPSVSSSPLPPPLSCTYVRKLPSGVEPSARVGRSVGRNSCRRWWREGRREEKSMSELGRQERKGEGGKKKEVWFGKGGGA